MEKEEGILKKLGRAFALVGASALLLTMIGLGVTYNTNKAEEETKCQCDCENCIDCEEKDFEIE